MCIERLGLQLQWSCPAPLTSRAEPWDQRRPQEGCAWELVCDKPDLLSTAITSVLWSLRASLVNSKHCGCPGFIEKLASVSSGALIFSVCFHSPPFSGLCPLSPCSDSSVPRSLCHTQYAAAPRASSESTVPRFSSLPMRARSRDTERAHGTVYGSTGTQLRWSSQNLTSRPFSSDVSSYEDADTV